MRARPFVAPGLFRVVGDTGNPYVAFSTNLDGDVIASTYSDGSWVGDLADTASLTLSTANNPQFTSARYLMLSTPAAIEVWDIDTNSVTSYVAPAGYNIANGANAVGSTVYWVEVESDAWTFNGDTFEHETTARLRSATLILGDVTTVSTLDISEPFFWEWRFEQGYPAHFISPTVALVDILAWDAVNSEVKNCFRLRFPLSGAAATYDSTPSNDIDGSENPLTFANPIPDTTDGAIGLLETSTGRREHLLTDELGAFWPTSANWNMAGFNLSMNSGSTLLGAYGSFSVMTFIADDLSGSYGATPQISFAVGNSSTGSAPDLFFFGD